MTNVLLFNLAMAVASVETGGDSHKINVRHEAYGPLQIRPAALKDLNEKFKKKRGLNPLRLADFIGNWSLSIWAFREYGKMYGAKTPEDFVKIWHWGPTGAKEEHPGDDYVERVLRLYYE